MIFSRYWPSCFVTLGLGKRQVSKRRKTTRVHWRLRQSRGTRCRWVREPKAEPGPGELHQGCPPTDAGPPALSSTRSRASSPERGSRPGRSSTSARPASSQEEAPMDPAPGAREAPRGPERRRRAPARPRRPRGAAADRTPLRDSGRAAGFLGPTPRGGGNINAPGENSSRRGRTRGHAPVTVLPGRPPPPPQGALSRPRGSAARGDGL